MAKGYDSLNDTFNTDDSVEVDAIVKADEVTKVDEVKKDYDYTRGNLYSLIEKGQEAINGIMEVAGETASPRAYEVAGQLIKSVADTTDKLTEERKLIDAEPREVYIIACLLLPIIGIGLYPRLITESYIASINNLVDRDLTAVKSAVKTNIFSGTKTNEILKAPTI